MINRRMFMVSSLAFSCFPLSLSAKEDTTRRFTEITKEILVGLRDNNLQYENISDSLEKIFNTKQISRLVAGRNAWSKANEQERQRFQHAIGNYLFNRYINNLKVFGINKTLSIVDSLSFTEQTRGKWTFYHTNLDLPPKIELSLRTHGGLIMDIEVEGLSFVLTFKDELKSIVRKNGLQGTTEILESRKATKR